MKDKKTWIGIIISVVAIYFCARGMDFKEVGAGFKEANYLYLFPAIFFIYLSIWLRAPRWRILLHDVDKKITLMRLFRISTIGFMGNSIFPARLGELIRAYFLSKNEDVTFTHSITTIALERVFDLFALVVYLSIVLLVFPFPKELIEQNQTALSVLHKSGYISTGMLVGFVVFIFFLLRFPGHTFKIIDGITKRFSESFSNKVHNITESIFKGLESVKDWKSIVSTLVYSILVWLAITLSEYMVLLAFDLNIGFWGAAFICVAIAFSVAAPSAPGYVGVFHGACILVLVMFFGESKELAGTVAIVMHGYQWIFIVLGGFIFLPVEGISLREVKSKTTEANK